jgi:predicted amidophosphoribosyltransferase
MPGSAVTCQGCLARIDQAQLPGRCPRCGAELDSQGDLAVNKTPKHHEFKPNKSRPAPYSTTFFRCLDCDKFEDDDIHDWETSL